MVETPISTTVHSLEDLPAARHLLARELERCGCPKSELCDIILATHEAAKNGLRFSGERPVYVTAHLCDDRITVCVADCGAGFEPGRCQPALCPDPQQSHGRGLHLMCELMDAVEVDRRPLGCVVRMSRRLVPAASA